MLHTAIVGLGDWSDVIAQAVQDKSAAIRLVTCCSRSPVKRAAFAAKYDTAQHETYQAVLGDADIEAVILSTPHSLHAEQVIEGAAAGKHVFCEKPFTLTATAGRAAAAACAEAAVVLAVGQNRRFSGAAREVKRRLDAGEFGTVLHFEANFSYPGKQVYKPGVWRPEALENPGGAMASCGIHMIDMATWLLGRIERVSAHVRRRVGLIDVDDTTAALLEFQSGAIGYLGTLYATPYTCFMNLYGTDLIAFAELDAERLRLHLKDEEAPITMALEIDPIDTVRAELDEFAAACRGEGQFRVHPDEAIHGVAVMEAIVASANADGRPITVGS